MTKTVYSVSGVEINLKDASTESLAEVLDGINDELSKLDEARRLLSRELAKRVPSGFEHLDGWQVSWRPLVHVVRKLEDA